MRLTLVVDVVHTVPVAAVFAFTCNDYCYQTSPSWGGIRGILDHLHGCPFEEVMSTFVIQDGFGRGENASLVVELGPWILSRRLTRSQERKVVWSLVSQERMARIEMERQLSSVQESQSDRKSPDSSDVTYRYLVLGIMY
ncbi:hypothetical protein Tco_1017684 [Tanacetum coccineum]|uniref:Uncharacterized protein n=1 Tax=Tanacetum coccineum TaxID=301880 RepID=A0ABQ5FSL5_9ASTR